MKGQIVDYCALLLQFSPTTSNLHPKGAKRDGRDGRIAGAEHNDSEGRIAGVEADGSEGQIAGAELDGSEDQILQELWSAMVSEGQIVGAERNCSGG
jgi:hypothetical protein